MKRILLGILFTILGSILVLGNEINGYKVLRVIDGDTIEVEALFLPKELKQVLHLRVYGVDTPEKGKLAKCDIERQRSLEAKDFVQREISLSKSYKVLFYKWDKYGGRVLGDIILDGKKLSHILLENGYAVEYDGGKKKGWC